jgi:hypothetical protein
MRNCTMQLLGIGLLFLAAGCFGTSDDVVLDWGDMSRPDLQMPVPLLDDGKYTLGLELAPFSGLRLREQLVITVTGQRGGAGAFQHVDLYALGVADPNWRSEKPIASVDNAAIAKDGSFKLDFGMLTLPGMASPTGTDVQLSLVLTGTVSDDNTFCGDLEGMVPAFMAPLTGSKFQPVRFGLEKMP